MDRQTGDGLPPVPSGVIRPQDGEPPRRAGGEISVFLGYLFCALGGLAATASPLAAALFVGFGMSVVSSRRPISARALGVLACVVPALVLGLQLDSSSLASALVACCLGAAVAVAFCDGRATAGVLCMLVGMATLVQLGSDALLAAGRGTTLASSMSSLVDVYLQQLGSLGNGVSEQVALVQAILRVVWPVTYVVPALGELLLAYLGVRIASTRMGERNPDLPDFAEFDLPLWVVALFVGALVGLAVCLTAKVPTDGIWFMACANVILAVRFAFAAQGLAVLSWFIRKRRPSGLMAALAVIAALYLEMRFIVMSIVGLMDVWSDIRHLNRGKTVTVQDNARQD